MAGLFASVFKCGSRHFVVQGFTCAYPRVIFTRYSLLADYFALLRVKSLNVIDVASKIASVLAISGGFRMPESVVRTGVVIISH